MKRFLFLLLLSVVSISPASAAQMFKGYTNMCGLPVVAARLSAPAVATVKDGRRVLLLNQSSLGNWKFDNVYAAIQQCAHVKLGHLSPAHSYSTQPMSTSSHQKLRSECWAVKRLAQNGYAGHLQTALSNPRSSLHSGPKPQGKSRQEYLGDCAGQLFESAVASKGGLPKGYTVSKCGCVRGLPMAAAREPSCASGKVVVFQCQAFCPTGGRGFGYKCQ